MFPLDLLERYTDLSDRQIYYYETHGLVEPLYQRGMKYYTLTDICVLRVVRVLLNEGIKPQKICDAHACLKNLKPDKPLSAFILFHNGQDILDFTNDPNIIASRFGQIVAKGLVASTIKPVAIGTELEQTKENIQVSVQQIQRRRKQAMADAKPRTPAALKKLLHG